MTVCRTDFNQCQVSSACIKHVYLNISLFQPTNRAIELEIVVRILKLSHLHVHVAQKHRLLAYMYPSAIT